MQYVHSTQISKPEILDNKDIPVAMKALYCIGEFTWKKKEKSLRRFLVKKFNVEVSDSC